MQRLNPALPKALKVFRKLNGKLGSPAQNAAAREGLLTGDIAYFDRDATGFHRWILPDFFDSWRFLPRLLPFAIRLGISPERMRDFRFTTPDTTLTLAAIHSRGAAYAQECATVVSRTHAFRYLAKELGVANPPLVTWSKQMSENITWIENNVLYPYYDLADSGATYHLKRGGMNLDEEQLWFLIDFAHTVAHSDHPDATRLSERIFDLVCACDELDPGAIKRYSGIPIPTELAHLQTESVTAHAENGRITIDLREPTDQILTFLIRLLSGTDFPQDFTLTVRHRGETPQEKTMSEFLERFESSPLKPQLEAVLGRDDSFYIYR
ncbi:hypothetical protein CMUST_10100 [Corynebacterium mustelae]|uniref:Uncharacterized protein n=1 Tax=Corynebacterium mustelae TaxID=571915 RepID=A0A0G3GYU9_9CORY|nr:hypothetical protein [Corynebacterium mustelae]AKK06336.1 hypothetical protein CMUST_10100 [Corynebacterium mustelae]